MTVTVALIARDEAARIATCLRSVGWADQVVVVVDDRTTDDTAAIARSLGACVEVHRFESYSVQRQRAQDLATKDWVLWMDCDEVVSPELAAEIRRAIADPQVAVYQVPRLDYMFGKWIRHGGWYPQYHFRLYRRDGARWTRDVHERIEFSGRVGVLRHPMIHRSHDNVRHWLERMNRYTSLEAHELFRGGARAGWLQLVIEPPLYAAYKYIWKQGWRDGAHGLALALLLGCYRLTRNLELWDLGRAARGREEPPDCPPRI